MSFSIFTDEPQDSTTSVDSQVNALATATAPATTGKRNVFLKAEASFSSSSASALFQIKFGAVVKFSKYIHGAGAIDAPDWRGMLNPVSNEAVTGELAAGGVGVTGVVTLTYYQR